jgi:hypothetical protein
LGKQVSIPIQKQFYFLRQGLRFPGPSPPALASQAVKTTDRQHGMQLYF